MFPDPLFHIFGQGIYLYGIMIAIGLLACFLVLHFYSKKMGMPSKVLDFIYIVAVPTIAIGFLAAKFYQAIYKLIDTGVFDFNAGITVMGGIIGGAAAFLAIYFGVGHFVFKGKDKGLHIKNFNKLFNIAPLCILIAHGFGRLGCLAAGCCHGMYLGDQYVFGGIWMKGQTHDWGYYAPAQLYEALFLFVAFAVLTIMYFKGCNITMALYLISYGIWRFIIEFIRTDYRGFQITFSPSQWQSFVFVLAGVALIIFYVVRKIPIWRKKLETSESVEIDNENNIVTENENDTDEPKQ